ncbi:hypothetical protein ACTMTF_11365 [Nonomuraea sp. ZG12]|uniref:hypothetical protein n=1 Tax=Nonomuraea sp. ZG12 TaxID=3452207 RepID=UPI003F899FC6
MASMVSPRRTGDWPAEPTPGVEGTCVSQSPWLRPAAAHRLWESLLDGHAR